MNEVSEELRDLVEVVVTPLVDYPEELEVSADEDGSHLLIEIRSNPDDAGKIIGRQGRVIKSVRTLTRAAASRKGVDVDVELID